ncbi:hypothetical protein CRM22_007500 [Opisthorchis felineus]|uniref:Phosphatidic acid phosphatase type 2/haloperoxidase domain-containing protein n=1 Tax=Opisthorchis felineus TaxID=147828 RepID=A0A4S2LG06_OPIFE|nr:hypothetical protein CRM22_007500 [Opisthorchis felineus]
MNKTIVNRVSRVGSDLLFCTLLYLAYFLIIRTRPRRGGYFCADQSIRYPYYKDTVSTGQVIVYGFSIPTVTILLVEILTSLHLFLIERSKEVFYKMGFRIYNFVIVYIVAAGITSSLTELFKRLILSPRPHLLDICQPNITVGNCTGYATEYECQGTNKKALDDAFLSFPSGHASFILVATTYTWLYLQERLHLKYSPMVRPTIQTIYACVGFYVMCTRLTDNKHHVPDVVAGSLLGAFCAITMFIYYLPRMDELTLWTDGERKGSSELNCRQRDRPETD